MIILTWPSNPFLAALLVWNFFAGVVGFAAMGADKSRSLSHGWRIRELTLVEIAFLGGWWDVLAGTSVFHHKTSHTLFMALVYLASIIWIVYWAKAIQWNNGL